MCTRYPIINRVSELKVHIELTRFVQPEKIEIDANERAVNEKSQYCFFVCTTFDSFLNDLIVFLSAETCGLEEGTYAVIESHAFDAGATAKRLSLYGQMFTVLCRGNIKMLVKES